MRLNDGLVYNGATFDGFVRRPRKQANLAVNYLDAINELEPSWRDPYKMATSLITRSAGASGKVRRTAPQWQLAR